MDKFKSWLTYNLVKLAAQLDGELFMRLCEVAVTAKYKDMVEDALAVLRLEQEHDYDYNYEREDNEITRH
jgi:hypothetical protein